MAEDHVNSGATEEPTAKERFQKRNASEVSFEDYAFVTAGLADGLELLQLLEHQGIDPRQWEIGEDFWSACVLEDLRRGAELSLELDAAQQLAREAWERRIPPLDEELRAWLDFQRQLGVCDDPAGMISAIPLAPGDLGRIQRLWAGRMEADAKLMDEAVRILAEPAQPVEVPTPAPPRLKKPRASTDGTGFFQSLGDLDEPPLPFQTGIGELPTGGPPPLRAVLPSKRVKDDLNATASIDGLGPSLALPFATGEPDEPAPAESPSPPLAPTPAPAAPPRPPPPEPSAPARIVDETVFGVAAIGEDALPFEKREAPAPAPSQEHAHPDMGQTVFGVHALCDEDALPFERRAEPAAATHDDVNATALGTIAPVRDALPFQKTPVAPPAPQLSSRQLAAVAVELDLAPEQRTAVLARYGMTESTHAVAMSRLEARLRAEPTARAEWDEAYRAYRAWRSTQGGAR